MAQHLRMLAALAGDPSSVPSTHRTEHSLLSLQFQGMPCNLLASAGSRYTCYSYVHAGKMPIYIT